MPLPLHNLTCVSPVDGRYAARTAVLNEYFSEFALNKYRVLVEIEYFIALSDLGAPFPSISDAQKETLRDFYKTFSLDDALEVKRLEAVTNHDVKSIEYFIKAKIRATDSLSSLAAPTALEFIHFALTSQDINNVAYPLAMKGAIEKVLIPEFYGLIATIRKCAGEWAGIAMLAHTHGQAASPTTLGKEFAIFSARLSDAISVLRTTPHRGKFGGAVGNFNAHVVACPEIDWVAFADKFLLSLGLQRSPLTTQIENYDFLAAQLHAICRANTICLDLSRDGWLYVHKEYLSQAVVAGEVGSSAMPHKVNPIDFENAEGNLGISTSGLEHMATKLPVSRLQRDLSDSTVLRNLGVPLAHTIIAISSLKRALGRVSANKIAIARDLDGNWAVVAEAVQTVRPWFILRRHGHPNPYEALKAATRTGGRLDAAGMTEIIAALDTSEEVKAQLRTITPSSFVGLAERLAKEEAARTEPEA